MRNIEQRMLQSIKRNTATLFKFNNLNIQDCNNYAEVEDRLLHFLNQYGEFWLIYANSNYPYIFICNNEKLAHFITVDYKYYPDLVKHYKLYLPKLEENIKQNIKQNIKNEKAIENIAVIIYEKLETIL